MSLHAVMAVYDGQKIKLLEPVPVQGPHRVIVTFIGPETEEMDDPIMGLRKLKGIWHDLDMGLKEIQAVEYKIPQDIL